MFGLKGLVRRVQVMIVLAVTGGVGIGGYVYRDHPVVRQLLGLAEKGIEGIDASGLAGVEAEAKSVLGRLVGGAAGKAKDDGHDGKPGRFEVTVADVRLDAAEFHARHAVDLEARVIRHDAGGGEDSVVWSSRTREKGAGRDHAGPTEPAPPGTVAAAWPDRPFEVDWTPGDEYTIELWDLTRPARPARWYALELGDDGSFPLRSRTHTLEAHADDKPTRDPSANTVVLKARRVGPGREPVVASTATGAEAGTERRSTRRR